MKYLKISAIFTSLLVLGALVPNLTQASGTLSLSQSSVNLSAGQNATITIYTSGGQMANVTNVTNAYVAYANISNNIMTIYGLGSGNTQITVCTFDNTCNSVYVTVNGNSYNNTNNYSALTLSPSSLNLNVGQTATVAVYGGNNNYYISSNPNSNVATTTISNNQVNVFANNNAGSTTVVVCSYSSSQCANLQITITNPITYQSISFSQNSVNLNLNQSTIVTMYGSSSFYLSNNTNSNAVTAVVSGNSLSLYANNTGSSTLTICSNSGGACGTVYAYVNSYSQNYGSTSGPNFTYTTLPQPTVNQYYSAQITVSNGIAPYSFTLSSGYLPAGLTLSRTGLISGIPLNNTPANFTLVVTDAYGRTSTGQPFSLVPVYSATNPYGNVLGSSVYANGTLINDNGTIYITYKNTKTGFATFGAFSQLGFKLSNVISGSTYALTNSGFAISSGNAGHPWGTWIKNGTTVYFVHETGLIPIDNYNVFISNGGQDRLITTANLSDFAKPILPVMTLSDYRLR